MNSKPSLQAAQADARGVNLISAGDRRRIHFQPRSAYEPMRDENGWIVSPAETPQVFAATTARLNTLGNAFAALG